MDGTTVRLFSKYAWIAIAVIGVVGFIFLLRSHTSHVFTAVPYLVLLLCPLMHIFMHKGHGKHGGGDAHHSKHGK